MTHGDDLEQRLRGWLVDDARPMPGQVLTASLDAIPITRQVPRTRWIRWLRFGPSPTIATAAAVIAVAILGAALISSRPGNGPGAGPRAWDPAAEFRRSPNEENPSRDSAGTPDVWRYLASGADAHDPAAYQPLSAFYVTDAPGQEDQAWHHPGFDYLQVGVAPTGVPGGPAQPGSEPAIMLMPSTDNGTTRSAVLAWRSPASGIVTVTGSVMVAYCGNYDGDGIDFSVDSGSASLFTAHIAYRGEAQVQATTSVIAGDSLYFIVAPGADAECFMTTLKARIELR